MKKQAMLPILFIVALTFLASCNSNPTANQSLKDDTQRKDIILGIVHHQPFNIKANYYNDNE